MSTKLTIRDWQEGDMPILADFHAEMNVGYSLPESFGPLYCVKRAVVDENGKVVAMATLRLTAEAYFWQDSKISSLTRAKSLKILSDDMAREAYREGLDDVSCWVPRKIAKCFTRIIEKLGWKRSPWQSWSRELK